jgi:uncharacterized membrane protein YphA (DoxX/SURF4 family)
VHKILQRFFSKFPGGAAGLGLLLLRATLSITVIIQGWLRLFDQENSTIWTKSFGLAVIVSGAMLLLGFLTPLSAFLVFLGSAISFFSSFQSTEPNLVAARFMVFSIAIILIGPGAFSLDARLFGRREIIIPEHQGSL